jgi:TonB family protein
MNEPKQAPSPAPIPVPDSTEEKPSDSAPQRRSLSNRILGYAFLASIFVNIGWITWVAHSDIFGSAKNFTATRETKIKVFHPIPQRPKPKPPKPLPPPPPPKQQPHIKPPPQLHIQRPQPRRAQPPKQTIQVARTTRSTPNQIVLPSVPDSPRPTKPFVPTDTPAPPAPPAPIVPDTPAPAPSPAPVAKPAPIAVKPEPVIEKPKPVVVRHPDNWVKIDTQEASFPKDLGDSVSTDGIDSGSITNPKVIISFTIDENGHAHGAHISESCGNSELDNRFLDAVRRGRGVPAIQDHIPRDAPSSLSFSVGV